MPVHILVVDDEPDVELLVRQRFRKRIRTNELVFYFAADGIEALQRLAEQEEIDVVLTDINMPRMDGLTLLGQIGELNRLLKVVIVSAYGDLDNIRTAMNRGAFDFVTKPINFEDLNITLDKTLREVATLKEGRLLHEQITLLRRDLEIARKIQLSVLPSIFPPFPDRCDFSLFATMTPAQEVGGDLYDFFLIDENRLGFSIGDVSGKGLGAAMFMVMTRTLLRATALQNLSVEDCVRHVNRVLYPERAGRLFVTLVYGILDTRTGDITYCNAGHNLPYVIAHDGRVENLEGTKSIGVCLVRDFTFQSRTRRLALGDVLFLYTDGVNEAADVSRELFSDERLRATLDEIGPVAPEEMIRHVEKAVAAFTAGAPPFDDMTMLALRFNGRDF